MHTPAFHGIVLAGGASRRMGADKAFVEVGGRPLISVALDALERATAITVIGGDLNRIGSLGVPFVADDTPGAGPLPAIAQALRESTAPITVVLPCDLLSITSAAVQRLVTMLGDADCIVPLVEGRPAWIPSAWRTDAGPTIEAAIHRGITSVRGAARGLRLAQLIDSRPSEWVDADRPEDLPLLGHTGTDATEPGLDHRPGLR